MNAEKARLITVKIILKGSGLTIEEDLFCSGFYRRKSACIGG